MGDSPAQSTGDSTAAQLAAYTQGLPDLLKVTAGQILPYGQAQLGAQEALAPGQNALLAQLYGQYAPQLQALGDTLNASELNANSTNANNLLSGSGQALIDKTVAAQKGIDPEYYTTRANTSDAVNRLLGSININGLSGSERDEVERSNAQQDAQRGTLAAPSQTATVNNAMQFGSALQAKRNSLAQAISTATSFLPSSQSGISAFNTGVTGTQAVAQPNPALSQFAGVNGTASDAVGSAGNNLLGTINNTATNAANINANQRDVTDRVAQVSGSLPT